MCCSFIHKTNTVEFKSATFPNAGSRHLLDDSVLESHTPTRGQAESSTLSSGISLGITHTHKATGSWTGSFFFYEYMSWSYDFRKQWRVGAQWGDVLACLWEVSLLKHSPLQTQYMTTCLSTYGHSMSSWNMLESNVTLPATHQPSLKRLPTLLFIIINLTQSLFSNTTLDFFYNL